MARIPKIRSRKDHRMVQTMSQVAIADVSLAPTGARTSFVYNKLGSKIRTTGATGAISTTVYDVLNRTVGNLEPLGKRSNTVYDAANRTVASVNALNQRSTTWQGEVLRRLNYWDAGSRRFTTMSEASRHRSIPPAVAARRCTTSQVRQWSA